MFCKFFDEATTSEIAFLPCDDKVEPSNGNNKPAARLWFSVTRTVFFSTGAATGAGATGAGAPNVYCTPTYNKPLLNLAPSSLLCKVLYN